MDATELQKQLRGLFYLLEEGVMELQQTTAALKVKQQKIQQGLLDCELGIFSREEAALAPLTPSQLQEVRAAITGGSGAPDPSPAR